MSKFGTLIKLNFKALLSAIKFGNNKKAKASGIGAVIFMAVISLYISGVYSFMFGDALSKAGLLEQLFPLIGILGFIMTIIMTVSAASGFVFSNKDSDLMLSLPVSAFSVMLSKILALYLECLIFCALFLLPSGVAYIHYGGAWDASLIIRLVIAALFLPVLSTLFCVILGWLLSWISAHSKHKSLVSSVIMFIFMAAVFYFSFQLNNLTMILVSNAAGFSHAMATWLLPFGLMQSGIISSWLAIVEFCLLCAVPFLLVVWLFSAGYKRILSGLASHDVRNDYKLHDVKATGLFSALFKKEARRYFGTTIYLFNTGIGSIMLLGASIYACTVTDKADAAIAQFGGIEKLLPIALLIFGFLLSMTNTTCVSISLEGKTLWILKEAPVPASTIFRAKAAVNLLVTWPVILISTLLLTVFYKLDLLTAASMAAAMLVFSLANALFGLLINLHYPKMDCSNDTIVVKQSASAFFGYFSGLLPLAVFALVYYLFLKSMALPLYVLLCAAVLILLSVFFWHRLNTWGAKKLIEL